MERNAAVVRMATLACGGRISVDIVDEEIERLRRDWRDPTPAGEDESISQLLGEKRWEEIDLFDCIQLRGVIKIYCESRSPSDAGHKLFGTSRDRKTTINDADRLRKYLARFGLDWQKSRAEKLSRQFKRRLMWRTPSDRALQSPNVPPKLRGQARTLTSYGESLGQSLHRLAKQACTLPGRCEPDQKAWSLAEGRTVPPSEQDGNQLFEMCRRQTEHGE